VEAATGAPDATCFGASAHTWTDAATTIARPPATIRCCPLIIELLHFAGRQSWSTWCQPTSPACSRAGASPSRLWAGSSGENIRESKVRANTELPYEGTKSSNCQPIPPQPFTVMKVHRLPQLRRDPYADLSKAHEWSGGVIKNFRSSQRD